MRRRWFSVIALTSGLAGCGYVGEPLPPALDIPEQITDLRGLQRGGKIFLSFTPTLDSTDRVVLKRLSGIELRAGENRPGGFNMDAWLAEAKSIPVEGTKPETTEVEMPAAEWAGKEVVFAVRAIGPSGRGGRWSNLLVLTVVPAPQPPVELTLNGTAEGLYLQWKGEGEQWRVWRKAEGENEAAVLGTAGERSWLDRTVEYGKSYAYTVQQLVPRGAAAAESEMSRSVSTKHEDRFPPAVPAGLAAIAGIKSVELNWDRNADPDWKACQVYRAEGDGPLQKLGEPVAQASFSDAAVETGRKYRYAVSAIDQTGNESAPCAAVEIVAP